MGALPECNPDLMKISLKFFETIRMRAIGSHHIFLSEVFYWSKVRLIYRKSRVPVEADDERNLRV